MAWINPHAKTTAYLEREEKKRAEREELLAKEREINRLTNLNKERKRSKKWLEQCENLAISFLRACFMSDDNCISSIFNI